MSLLLKGVSFSYQKNPFFLKDINILFQNGVNLILGPNGAGKSTLLKVIAGILTPYQGKIYLNQQAINTKSACYKYKLGYIPQSLSLPDQMTIRRFLFHLATFKGINSVLQEKEVTRVINQVKLKVPLTRCIGQLSTGEKRKLTVAQALLNNPDIILADEATQGLDLEEKIWFFSLLATMREYRIILFSTNTPEEGEGIADQILFLEGGELKKCYFTGG